MTIAAYPKHHSFKPSGFDWIGDVPEHWDVEKLGSMLTAVSEKNRPDLPLLSITREQGVIERDVEDQDSNHNFIPDDLSGYRVLREGQFGMNKMKAWQGSYGVSAHTGIVSPAYFIFDFAREVDPHFFNIAIRSKLYVSYFGSASDGVRVGQWDLNQSRMRQIPILLPPLPEQRAIAAFLDGKCATIDEAVRIKGEQIRLLAERRQILIQQVVTRGLNPNVPMKDSDIDWIGQIPAHWEMKRLKDVSRSVKTGRTPPSSSAMDYFEGGTIPWYTPGDVQDGGVFDASEKRLSPSAISHGHVDMFPENCIFFIGIGGTLGKANISRVPASCNQQFNVIEPNKDIVPDWLLVWLNVSRDVVFNQTDYTTMPIMNQAKTKRIPLPVPSLGEQEEILRTLRDRRAKINAAIALKESQITALREYKTSLINAAVTGKIKVL